MDELLEESCIRELMEETGLSLEGLQQFKVYDSIHRDPRGRTISVVFYAESASQYKAEAGDDADLTGWFSFTALPPMAFDHKQIVHDFYSEKICKNH